MLEKNEDLSLTGKKTSNGKEELLTGGKPGGLREVGLIERKGLKKVGVGNWQGRKGLRLFTYKRTVLSAR